MMKKGNEVMYPQQLKDIEALLATTRAGFQVQEEAMKAITALVEKAYKDGYDDGYDDGVDQGYSVGENDMREKIIDLVQGAK